MLFQTIFTISGVKKQVESRLSITIICYLSCVKRGCIYSNKEILNS